MSARIRELGGGDTRKKVKHKTVYMWHVPYKKKEDATLNLPNLEQDSPF
jgi:hypothetical protein